MNVTLSPASPKGVQSAIASKSAAHRLLICAAFADRPTRIRCEQSNEDIEATVDCLRALGATVCRVDPFYTVTPIATLPKAVTLPVRESGSTLRFLLPVVAAFGIAASFDMRGRLPFRPLSPLRELLSENGYTLSAEGTNPLTGHGTLCGNTFSISGAVSSQFISGMLFALAIAKRGGTLTVEGDPESAPYVDMTVDALRRFGVAIHREDRVFSIPTAPLTSVGSEIAVEGDWSGAAFPLCAAALRGEVTLTGLSLRSHQGDRMILSLLEQFGAHVFADEDRVTVSHGTLHGIDIDARQIPDLVPVLAVVASVAEGVTRIFGASRLRLKESDRLAAVTRLLTDLGGEISETDDGLIIRGKQALSGGTVHSAKDHRIAMSAAVASVVCRTPVTILEAEVTAKSYPAFFADMEALSLFSIS